MCWDLVDYGPIINTKMHTRVHFFLLIMHGKA